MASLLIAFIAFAVCPSSAVFYNKENSRPIGFNDFLYYYGTGSLVKNGSTDIYNSQLQQENLSNIIGAPVANIIPYLYPPQSLLFFAPLAEFPLKTSFRIWLAFNILATLSLLVALYFFSLNAKPGSSLLAASLIIFCYPWVTSIMQGQTTILMTAGLLGYQLLARYKHHVLAGLLIVLIAFKPQLILAPVLYVLIINGRSLWVSTIAAALAIIIICSFLFGFSIWQSYMDVILAASKETDKLGVKLNIMGNIRALLLFFAGEKNLSAINIASSLLWVGSVIAAVFIAIKMRTKTQELQDMGFGLIIAISCLFSPWLHIHSLVLLIIPLAYLAKYNDLRPRYLYAGGLINFNLLAMFVDSYGARFNPLLWVFFQTLLISFISYNILLKNKKTSTLSAVNP